MYDFLSTYMAEQMVVLDESILVLLLTQGHGVLLLWTIATFTRTRLFEKYLKQLVS